MEFILYNKIKEKLVNQYNILRGGVDPNVTKPYEPIPTLNDIDSTLKTLQSYTGYETLKTNLDEYKKRIDKLIIKIDEKIPDAKEIASKLDPSGYVRDLFNNAQFKTILDNYNQKLVDVAWNGERVVNDVYLYNDPDRDDIFMKPFNTTDEDFIEFNKQMLLLFSPFMNNYVDLKDKTKDEQKIGLNKNLDDEIVKIQDLIKIGKDFNIYLTQKRKNIDNILKSDYNKDDIAFIDNKDKNISEDKYIQELKEASIPDDAQLNLAAVRELENIIKDTTDFLDITNEMKDLKNFNILNTSDNLKDILNIDNVVTLVKPISGGAFENPYITSNDTNTKLLKLLKLLEKLYELIETVLDDSQYLKEIQYRYNFYVAYLFLIIRQTSSKDILIIYKYLPKNKVLLYIDILNKIKSKFTNLSATDVNTIYLNKYHYLNIEKIYNVLNFILTNFPSDDNIIDIDNCKGKILSDLTIFNHFRSILIEYVNSNEGKNVTGVADSTVL